MFQDLRFGARMLLKNKMFTAVAALSLALGIGANTAIFSLINALMLRSLPVKAPQELALFSIVGLERTGYHFNYPLYEMIRDRNQSFTGVITANGVANGRLIVDWPGGGAVESVQHQRVSGNFFSVLGAGAVVGRVLTEADDMRSSGQSGAVISFDFWRRRFGLDPAVVGRRITVNDTPLVIAGVAPPGFFGFDVGSKPELWWPIKAMNDDALSYNQSWWIQVIGRLRPGVSASQAQAEVDLIFRQQLEEIAARWTPTERQGYFARRIALESGSVGYSWLRLQFRRPLLILMIAVALTLLVACVNIANLLLARAATRRKEIAVRLAVGAGRFRLIRQLLTESVLLAALGGGAGLIFARFCVRALLVYLPRQNRALDVPLDARVLGFTLAASVLTGLLFGLAPAWQATRLDLTASLKDQAGAGASRSRLMLNKLLVVTQVALSLFLLVGAGLFARSLRNLRTLDAGIDYKNIVQFRIDSGRSYDLARRANLHRQALSRLEALPGAHSATLVNFGLLSGGYARAPVTVPGYAPGRDEDRSCTAAIVGPRFFETMGMPLLAGRDFGPQDERPIPPARPGAAPPSASPNAPPSAPISAVINQAMARRFFGDENPVGKRFSGGGTSTEIVGVVKDAKYADLRKQSPPTYYLYYFQQPLPSDMTIYLRADGDAAAYAATIERLARELNPQSRVVGLEMMGEMVNEKLLQERFIAQVGGAFSLFALALACIGLYGVMSYAVSRRTNEIGIRMALGAQRKDVVWLVMREVSLLVAVGVGAGLAAAVATTRLVSALLFGLTPNDPTTIALATLLMIGVAALAGYLPARRAARVDPMVALRCE